MVSSGYPRVRVGGCFRRAASVASIGPVTCAGRLPLLLGLLLT
jgi:hypothetical protein